MTDTLEHRPPESAEDEPYRAEALFFLATGMTADGVRAHAASAFYVERTARIAGLTTQEAYTQLLAIADAIGRLERGGLTRQTAYLLGGLDENYGPYPGPDSLSVA
jgi:hypothetical protein